MPPMHERRLRLPLQTGSLLGIGRVSCDERFLSLELTLKPCLCRLDLQPALRQLLHLLPLPLPALLPRRGTPRQHRLHMHPWT